MNKTDPGPALPMFSVWSQKGEDSLAEEAYKGGLCGESGKAERRKQERYPAQRGEKVRELSL